MGFSIFASAQWWEWSYAGVDHALTGNGGLECANFIPTHQKLIETFAFVLLGLVEILASYPKLSLAEYLVSSSTKQESGVYGKALFLMILCLTFGVELGFKLATKQMIWIFNPCHLVTVMQIYLLVAPPSRTTMTVFRLSMHCLSGATIAIILPVVNTRLLTFEAEVYYVQHILLLIIPLYLISLGGVYTPEPLRDFSWVTMAMGLLFVYHWAPLQLLALLSLVNLNNMLCPAVSDPFYSRWYRICAAIHQTICILIHGKLYTWIAHKIIALMRSVRSDNSLHRNECHHPDQTRMTDDCDDERNGDASKAHANGRLSNVHRNEADVCRRSFDENNRTEDIANTTNVNGHLKIY